MVPELQPNARPTRSRRRRLKEAATQIRGAVETLRLCNPVEAVKYQDLYDRFLSECSSVFAGTRELGKILDEIRNEREMGTQRISVMTKEDKT